MDWGVNKLLHRVSLLQKALFPDMRDRMLPSTRRLAATATAERTYMDHYRRHVEWLQCHGDIETVPMNLSFSPIAKNLRGMGTTIYNNVDQARRTVIIPGNDFEEELLRSQGRPAWKPWLWSRIPRGQLHNVENEVDDAKLAWPTYFLAPTQATPGYESDPEYPRRWPMLRRDAILRLAVCTGFAFRLNPASKAAVDQWLLQLDWDDEEPKLGIHLRRGDAATEDLTRQTRNSYPLETYLANADLICKRYGIRTIYMSTESQQEIERAQQLRPKYRFLWLHHDRSVFPKLAETTTFIEDTAFSDPSIIEPVVLSAIADLWLLQNCNAFIGTFNSEFSILAWLLCIGEQGHVVPYINLARQWKLELFQGNLEFLPY